MEMNDKDGAISEWNEGNLFSLRLHEAKELINCGKMNPLIKINLHQYGYEIWKSGIDILYGEGNAKWREEEKVIAKTIKDLLDESLMLKQIHKVLVSNL